MERSKYIIPVLCGISVQSLLSAYIFSSFPWLIAIAISPILALYTYCKEKNLPFTAFGIPVVICFTLIFSILASLYPENSPGIPMSINFGIIISFAFFAYWLTNTYSANKLGFITIIIFYTGIEFMSLVFVPEYSNFLLGNVLKNFPAIQAWNSELGLIGVTAWILMANIATYYIFFRDFAIFRGKLRWRSLILSFILISIPALISIWFYNADEALTARNVTENFSGMLASGTFDDSDELFGRTTAWVSILIILYGLVRSKVNK